MTPTTEPTDVQDLFDRAMRLPPDVRERFAFDLLRSVNPPPNSDADWAYWKAEIARRIAAVENGTMKTYTLEETIDHLQKVLDEDPAP